jgi:hypothetical protein
MNGTSGGGSNGTDLGAVLLLVEKIDRRLGKASTNLVVAQEKLAELKIAVAKLAKVWSESETSEEDSSGSEDLFPRPPTPFPEWFPPQ